jgi:predicted amidohydrolase
MLKIALAQLNPTIGDLAGNGERILAVAEKAIANQVDLLLTPELSICGYPPRDLLLNASFQAAMAERLQSLAQQLPAQLSVLVGLATIAQPPGKPLHNSVALLHSGQVQQVFHKQLLPTYDVFDENRYFQPGESSNYFQIGDYRVGVTICEDLWNDEEFWGKQQYLVNPIAELAQQSVDLIVNLSASPYSVGKQRLREAMLQHTARRYQQPIVYVNQVGANDDLIFTRLRSARTNYLSQSIFSRRLVDRYFRWRSTARPIACGSCPGIRGSSGNLASPGSGGEGLCPQMWFPKGSAGPEWGHRFGFGGGDRRSGAGGRKSFGRTDAIALQLGTFGDGCAGSG